MSQAHTLGPGVVGGGMGPHWMRQNPRPRGRVRQSPRPWARRKLCPWGQVKRSPHPRGRARWSPWPRGRARRSLRPRGRVRRSPRPWARQNPCPWVGRDGARTQEVGRDRACGLRVGQDLLIRLQPSGEVSVGANFLALGIPNIDTRQRAPTEWRRHPTWRWE